jgi:hypothetical protein
MRGRGRSLGGSVRDPAGEIFDHVYEGASLGAVPLTGMQTVSVPPGAATVVDSKSGAPPATRSSTTRYRDWSAGWSAS